MRRTDSAQIVRRWVWFGFRFGFGWRFRLGGTSRAVGDDFCAGRVNIGIRVLCHGAVRNH